MNEKAIQRLITRSILLIAALVLVIQNLDIALAIIKLTWSVLLPLIIGFAIAYVINIIYVRIEKIYFPTTKNIWIDKSRKIGSLLCSYAVIILVVALIIYIVLPQVSTAVTQIVTMLPDYMEKVEKWIVENGNNVPFVSDYIVELELNWDSIMSSIADFMENGASGIITSSVGVIMSFVTGVFNIFVAIVFSIYILLDKNHLIYQVKRLQQTFLNKKIIGKMDVVFTVANESFQSFIVGQFLEAIVLGVLCTIGMWIFRFPYATTIGIFVGTTALIPIFGAWFGGIVGVLLILMVDPIKAILFIVFIFVLQQLEGDLIYPKIVGNSIGLPGIWVFVAVIIGGGFGGVLGMLLGVPVFAIIYKLLKLRINKDMKKTTD